MPRQPDILDRIIEPKQGGFSKEHALYVLSLDFSADEHSRYAELAAKAQEGHLTVEDQAELDDFLTVNAMLAVLQSKARISLSEHSTAA